MRRRQFLPLGLLALLLLLCADSVVSAARLLTATVERDGQTILQTAYQDDGRARPATVWRYLAQKPLWAEGQAQVAGDVGSSLDASVRGALVIRVQHGDHVIVEAKADQLALVRSDATSNEWFLPAEEVERLAQANGIPALPPAFPFPQRLAWLGLGAAALAVLVILFAWLAIGRRQQSAHQ